MRIGETPRMAVASPVRRVVPRAAIVLVVGVVALARLGGLPASVAGEPGSAQALADRAIALLGQAEKSGDATLAIDAADLLERAIRLDPENPEWVFQRTLAFVVARAEDRARASFAALEAVVTAPLAARDPRVLYARALLHATFGSNVAEALRLLDRLKNRSPDFLPAAVRSLEFHCRIAYTAQLLHLRPESDNERQEHLKQAVNQAKLAVGLVAGDPREPIARRNLAQVFRVADRWPESEAEFRALATAFPGDAVVHYGLASVLADQHKYDEAFAEWERFLRIVKQPGAIDPREADSVADAQMRYGVSLDHAGREADGLKQLRAYVARVPQDPRGWYYLGRLLLQSEDEALCDPKEARTCLEKSRELDPWCAGPLQLLRQVYQLVLPDEAKLAEITKELEDPARQAARKATMDQRKRVRPDATNGCE
jgi:predicted Zn-dependent protease